MAREPFLPLFFGDFLAATSEWEGEERALYLLLLGYQWSLGSLPSEPRKLCKMIGWDADLFERCWQTVRAKFRLEEGRLRNRRLEDHRAKSNEISRQASVAGRKGAAARWHTDADRNGDRHQSANGDPMATAIKNDGDRHQSANGSIPSHPIPSQSIPDVSPDRTSQDTHSVPLSAPPQPVRGSASCERAEEAWRDVGCDAQAYESWLSYREGRGDPVPAHVRLEHAKWLCGKGAPELQREFVATCIRLEFKRLHDPAHPADGHGARKPRKPYVPALTADQAEEAERLKVTPREYRALKGLPPLEESTP